MRPRMKKWIEALRSGKYAQGQNALKVGGSYCCLGVLCEINRPANLDFTDFLELFNGGKRGELSSMLMKKYGIPSDFTTLLIQLNDNFGFDFDEIADVVQAYEINGFDKFDFFEATDEEED